MEEGKGRVHMEEMRAEEKRGEGAAYGGHVRGREGTTKGTGGIGCGAGGADDSSDEAY